MNLLLKSFFFFFYKLESQDFFYNQYVQNSCPKCCASTLCCPQQRQLVCLMAIVMEPVNGKTSLRCVELDLRGVLVTLYQSGLLLSLAIFCCR